MPSVNLRSDDNFVYMFVVLRDDVDGVLTFVDGTTVHFGKGAAMDMRIVDGVKTISSSTGSVRLTRPSA